MSRLHQELKQIQKKYKFDFSSITVTERIDVSPTLISVVERLNSSNENSKNTFHFDKLQSDLIFSEAAIKELAITYRLRFLSTSYYKNEIPKEAIHSVLEFENEHQTQIENFKILAPKENFALQNYDDPLLFMSLGNGYYYLLAKWGNDLSVFRKIKYWPFRNIFTLVTATLLLSLLVLVICGLINPNLWVTSRALSVFLFSWKTFLFIFIYYTFKTGNYPSEFNWNSAFYNK